MKTLRDESVATQHASQWLHDRRICPRNVVGPERRALLRAYIARLKTLPKPEPRAWAYETLSRIAEGESIPPICEAMAREVVAMDQAYEPDRESV